jgi:hypothetical protein
MNPIRPTGSLSPNRPPALKNRISGMAAGIPIVPSHAFTQVRFGSTLPHPDDTLFEKIAHGVKQNKLLTVVGGLGAEGLLIKVAHAALIDFSGTLLICVGIAGAAAYVGHRLTQQSAEANARIFDNNLAPSLDATETQTRIQTLRPLITQYSGHTGWQILTEIKQFQDNKGLLKYVSTSTSENNIKAKLGSSVTVALEELAKTGYLTKITDNDKNYWQLEKKALDVIQQGDPLKSGQITKADVRLLIQSNIDDLAKQKDAPNTALEKLNQRLAKLQTYYREIEADELREEQEALALVEKSNQAKEQTEKQRLRAEAAQKALSAHRKKSQLDEAEALIQTVQQNIQTVQTFDQEQRRNIGSNITLLQEQLKRLEFVEEADEFFKVIHDFDTQRELLQSKTVGLGNHIESKYYQDQAILKNRIEPEAKGKATRAALESAIDHETAESLLTALLETPASQAIPVEVEAKTLEASS